RRSAESYGPRLYGAPCAGRFSNLSRSPVRQERESLQGIPEPLRGIANVAAKRLRASRVAVHSPIGASEKTAVLHEDHLARAELDPIAVKNDAKPEASSSSACSQRSSSSDTVDASTRNRPRSNTACGFISSSMIPEMSCTCP